MKIQCLAPIKSFTGEQVSHGDGSKATFRSIVLDSLLTRYPDDQRGDYKTSWRCFKLAEKLSSAEFVDLEVEDLSFIKDRVVRGAYSHLVTGRIIEIIEGSKE